MENNNSTDPEKFDIRKSDGVYQNFIDLRKKIISIIGHDLRGPVGSIKMLADMILDNPDDYSREELIETIQNFSDAAGSASGLLENLMAWSMISNNDIRFNPLVQEIGPLVLASVTMITPMAKKKGIELTTSIPADITACFDKDMVRIVIRNLLENAIKFTASGGRVIIQASDPENKMVEVSITDNGTGIPEENLVKLNAGEQFFTTYGTNNEKGSGLGLMLCRDFLLKNHGMLSIGSKTGEGSRFAFKLPSVNPNIIPDPGE